MPSEYRELLKYNLSKLNVKNALFWAEKAFITSNDHYDLYWYAYMLIIEHQYQQAYFLLDNIKDLDTPLLYLKSLALFNCKNYKEALDVIENISYDQDLQTILDKYVFIDSPLQKNKIKYHENNLYSLILCLKGKIYQALDCFEMAKKHLILALYHDFTNFEALNILIKNSFLKQEEIKKLIQKLIEINMRKVTHLEQEKMHQVLDSYSFLCNLKDPIPNHCDRKIEKLHAVERKFYSCQFTECLEIITKTLKMDMLNSDLLIFQISCLYHLQNTKELFKLSHNLINYIPSNPLSWYAISCYYNLMGKIELTRMYLNRALALDKFFTPAWLLLGHTYGLKAEHDQAMVTYFQALKYLPNCHLVYLYIGIEHAAINNQKIGLEFALQASEICHEDPVVLHEIGVLAYHQNEYEVAWQYFTTSLHLVSQAFPYPQILPPYWEPLYVNLGQTARKLKKYDEAIRYFGQALRLNNQAVSTYTALGLVHMLKAPSNIPHKAIEILSKGLAIDQDDKMCKQLLNYLMEKLVDQETD